MIQRWSEGVAADNMPEDILVELSSLINRHPWWRARAKLTQGLLGRLGVEPPARVLDVGCGWGTTLEALERAGYRATGADISRKALERLDRPGRELVEVDLTKPLPEGVGEYDAVLALDVIEHLDDDRAAVGRLGELASPGGYVVVSVPARPDLFSEFDTIQGHRRRYLPDTLESAFQVADLELTRTFWWGAWMVPLLRRSRRHPKAAAGESTAEAYCRYLSLPPWPVPLVMKAAYVIEEPRAGRQAPRRDVALRRRSPGRANKGCAASERRTGAKRLIFAKRKGNRCQELKPARFLDAFLAVATVHS